MRGVFGAMPSASTRYCCAARSPCARVILAYDQGPDGMPVILHSAKLRRNDKSLMTLGDAINASAARNRG